MVTRSVRIASALCVAAMAVVAAGPAAGDEPAREFKISLQEALFPAPGPEAALERLKDEVVASLTAGIKAEKAAVRAGRQRNVRFHDSQGSCVLRKSGVILRERIDDTRRVLTLKLRGDGTGERAALGSTDSRAEIKVEDDVSSPWTVQRSKSISVNAARDAGLASLADAGRWFTGLDRLAAAETRLTIVSATTFAERTWRIMGLAMNGRPLEVDVSLWSTGAPAATVSAELSFRDAGQAPASGPDTARQWFEALQRIASASKEGSGTKTEFAYTFAGSAFCAR